MTVWVKPACSCRPGEPASLQLRSIVRASGELELSLVDVPMPEPKVRKPEQAALLQKLGAVYGKAATGEKFLVNPNKGLQSA